MTEELPGNWEASPGERIGEDTYTRFFHNPENRMQARQYSDHGETHTIQVIGENGYAKKTEKFESEEEADKAVNRVLQEYADV